MDEYKILATRQGGFTGYAQSYLKSNSKELVFTDIKKAKRKAKLTTKQMNNEHSSAHYTYQVVKI